MPVIVDRSTNALGMWLVDPLTGDPAAAAAVGPATAANSRSVASATLAATAIGDGSVTNLAETITVAAGTQYIEFFNLSANVIWASWTGTAAANTAGSFPIRPLSENVAGYYAGPPGASGSLSIIAPAGASAFTCNRWA